MSSQRRRERNSQRNANNDFVFEAFDPFTAPMTIAVLNDPLEDDAAVARALQEEYEEEYRRSQLTMQQRSTNVPSYIRGTRVSPTAPIESSARGAPSSAPPVQEIFRGQSARRTESRVSRSNSTSRRSAEEFPDEDFAKRLERELSLANTGSEGYETQKRKSRSMQDIADEEYARRLERELSHPRVLSSSAAASLMKKESQISATAATSRSNSEDNLAIEVAMMTADDEVYARKIEQELEDERLAERIRRQEQQRVDNRQATSLQHRQVNRKCWWTLLPILLILGAVGGILYFFMFGDEGLPNWMP